MGLLNSIRGSFGKRRIFWHNHSGAFAIGLDRVCPITNVACLDDGHEYKLIEKRSGVDFCSVERSTGQRVATHYPEWDDIAKLLGARIREILLAEPCEAWWLASPRRSPKLEGMARQGGYGYLGPPADLCHWLNHKANFFQGCEQLGLAHPPGRWLHLAQARHGELRSGVGERYVLWRSPIAAKTTRCC